MSTNKPSETTLKMHEMIAKEGKEGWGKLWENGITPWNIKKPAPPLVDLLSSPQFKDIIFPKCLVPGCGEGFDAKFLSQREGCVESIGIDLTAIAVKKCIDQHSPLPSNLKFIQGNFFEYKYSSGFDLMFDYTFLCALPPNLRENWAESVAGLIKHGGHLVTLMFPVGEYFEGGPPFSLSTDIYNILLAKHFKVVYGPVETDETIEVRKGRELIAVWQRNTNA
jgi:hypothetical protein